MRARCDPRRQRRPPASAGQRWGLPACPARAPRRTCSSSRARLTEITPALQPMPLRLYDTTLDAILKWLTIMADSDGVGLNSEQLTIRMSTCAPARGARVRVGLQVNSKQVTIRMSTCAPARGARVRARAPAAQKCKSCGIFHLQALQSRRLQAALARIEPACMQSLPLDTSSAQTGYS